MSFCNLSSTVDELPINPVLISKLKKANFLTLKKILNFSLPELQRIAKVSAYEAKIIFQAASTTEVKTNETDALTMLSKSSSCKEKLPFNFFDTLHFDGIYTGTITEICGESGSGKTQLCLLLTICALIPGCFGDHLSKVIYMHSEGKFPIGRFLELSKSFKKKNPLYKDLNFMDNLILKKVYNLKETIHVMQNGMPELLQQKNFPRVIIIDSVAELLRGEYDTFNLRNLMIRQLAVELWKLAHIYKMAVICVNQVSGSIQKNFDSSSAVSTNIPSLGLMWANILTTRLRLFRKEKQEELVTRAFEVIFSAYHPRLVINFIINQEGVVTLDEHLLN